MAQRFLTLIFLFFCTLLPAQASLFGNSGGGKFVPVDQAFSFDFSQHNNQVKLNWQIRPGYYLYQQQIQVVGSEAQLGAFSLPQGVHHKDEFYGDVITYRDLLSFSVPLRSTGQHATLSVTYQGCAEAGFCYPPETKLIPLQSVSASAAENAAPAAEAASPAQPEHDLPFSPLWALLIGIGIAFTPCVLPMYPLISAIILGREKPHSHRHILVLSLVYVQGMALTYTVLGIVVAAAGMQFQAAFQHPYVLIGLSALFIVLAMSMFGLFSLQLPSSLQTRLTLWSNQQKGGSLLGVFAMGALAGLICSPCTTAPLTAILLYIAQSGNLLAGGGTLYLYALGMGLPLVLVTTFGNRLLPRSGPWMQNVKEAFGFIILALPIFLLERVLGDTWGLRLWSILGVAFFGWAFIVSLRSERGLVRVLQLILLAAALICARPLQDWVFGAPTAQQDAGHHLAFRQVNTLDELQQALDEAKANRQPVMFDLYADWCVSCKEFEKYTFSDPLVQQQLSGTLLLQADVTANNAQHNAILKHFNVLGLPTILFFSPTGEELTAQRVTGFMDADTFRAHLQKR